MVALATEAPETPPPVVPPKAAKLPAKQVTALVELTAIMLGQAKPKHQMKVAIRRYFHEKLGREVSARTCETYIARAKAFLVEASNKPKQELFEESVAFWYTTIQDPSASRKDKMYARERLDNLYGLEAPKVLRIKGKIATREMTDEELMRVAMGDGSPIDRAGKAVPEAAVASEGVTS